MGAIGLRSMLRWGKICRDYLGWWRWGHCGKAFIWIWIAASAARRKRWRGLGGPVLVSVARTVTNNSGVSSGECQSKNASCFLFWRETLVHCIRDTFYEGPSFHPTTFNQYKSGLLWATLPIGEDSNILSNNNNIPFAPCHGTYLKQCKLLKAVSQPKNTPI